jgi:drug/metabolite transporter (DMT)-like permease
VDRFAPFLFVFLWSTGFIGAKFGLPHAEPLSFLLVRYAIVVALLAPVSVATGARWPSEPRKWAHLAVSGVLVHGLYLGGVFVALSRGLPAGVTSLVVGLQPILTAVGAGALLGERVSPRQWAGLGLGFAGAALVLSGRLGTGASAATTAAAVLPALVALAGITAGTLYQKRYCPIFDLRTGAVVQFVAAGLVTLPFALATESLRVDWSSREFLFATAWLVVVLSLGAINLLNLLIRRGTAVNVARLFFLVPPTTALIAFAAFQETLRGRALAGMALAVAGVYLARAGGARRPAAVTHDPAPQAGAPCESAR